MFIISSTKAIEVAMRITDANTSCNFLKKETIGIFNLYHQLITFKNE
jgi:hypothetical protein